MKLIPLLFVFIVSGCSLRYIDLPRPPKEAYWGKSGFDLEETREFMIGVCGYEKEGASSSEDFFEIMAGVDKCMLRNGFVYLTDFHGVTQYGYGPLSNLCTKKDRFRDLPSCQSLRKR